MPSPTVQHPIMLGIVGESAAGKTTLSDGVAEIIGRDRISVLCVDDYHRYTRAERQQRGLPAAHPGNNYLDIVEQHLWLLRHGRPILKPVYDHRTGVFGAPVYLEPKPYIIVDGLLAFATRAMRDCFNVKLYLEPDEQLRIRWKLQRDTAKRGYSACEVQRVLGEELEASRRYLQPQRSFADIVIGFQPPDGKADETGARLNARHMLRPTLSHPDVTPLLEPTVNNGLTLELSRDRDGKPVDVLEIAGDIEARRAKRLEDLLWNLIPEASSLRAGVGEFEAAGDRRVTSHPLALTQLLIAYYMEKAAIDRAEDRGMTRGGAADRPSPLDPQDRHSSWH